MTNGLTQHIIVEESPVYNGLTLKVPKMKIKAELGNSANIDVVAHMNLHCLHSILRIPNMI